jgi:hypothetical protein
MEKRSQVKDQANSRLQERDQSYGEVTEQDRAAHPLLIAAVDAAGWRRRY